MTPVEPIAIIGIGCRMPGGVGGPDDMWRLLSDGVDAVVEVPEERWHLPSIHHPDPARPGRMNTRWGGFLEHQVDRFDAQFFETNPREAARMDPQQRLLLEVAYQAVEDAGLTMASLSGKRVAVYVGISTWDYSFLQIKAEERETLHAYTNIGTALCIAANRISYFFNLVGPSAAVDTACSSSLVAAHVACRSIWNGESELAFVGGVNLMLQPEVTIAFSKASMLSPDGRCKSFDSRANGYVRGEGAGLIILKPLARALADGDRVYAVIRATAVNQDGRTAGISVPSQASQESNIKEALRLADISPASIQYVEAHGTGTPVGDPIEAAALGAIYGKARNGDERCVLGSIKSNMGHLEAGAGIAGLIKTALCLHHRQIPTNLHFENPNPQIPFDDLRLRVAQRLEPWPKTNGQPPRAGVNSFGFGGTNGHAILEAAPEIKPRVRTPAERADSRAWLLPISARSEPALSDLARSYLDSLAQERGLKSETLRDICYSASVKRSHHDFRLALVAHDRAELAEQLEAAVRGEERANCSTGRTSGMPLKPVFVCSGMGQQWWAMGRELLSQEPVFRRAVDEVSELFGSHAGWSLLEKLTADQASSQVQETRVGQPAIFALQVGLAALFRSWGVEPAAVLGHSAGEMAATYISGALSLEDAVRVTFHRSRLQFRTAGQGGMLAVGISREEAARLVERHPRAISIAAINGLRSVTLSGDLTVLAEIDKALNEADVFSRALQVDVPYHSPKMEQLEKELLECLSAIRPRPATTPFFSTVTGTELVGSEIDARYWYRNVREPVLFHDTMARLVDGGHRVFLEIGAHPVLRRDIAACLSEKSLPGATLGSLRREDRERAALMGSLGRLYSLGAEIDWHKLYPSDATAIKLPSYRFQAESHWRESDQNRRLRVGRPAHPLLGIRLEVSTPSWKGDLGSVDLSYLADHGISDSIVFPGAGYVEMGLAAAREIFGPVPCVLEDIEFQRFLFLDQGTAPAVQVKFDTASSEYAVYVRAEGADNSWDMHAHGCIRQPTKASAATVDIAEILQRLPEPLDGDECQLRFAAAGFHYGPTFQGVRRLWRGDREIVVEVQVPESLHKNLPDYLLHPAVLDACFQTMLPAFPTWTDGQNAKDEIFVPVKIERVRFNAALPTRIFAYTQVINRSSRELKVDLQVVDEAGAVLAEVQGLTARPSGHRVQRTNGTLYENQWKLSPRATGAAGRDSHHLASPEVLASAVQQEAEVLHRRFARARFQNEFQQLSRTTAAGYIVRALRQLGWTPTPNEGALPIGDLARRLGIAPDHHRWLGLVLKELTPRDIASTEDPDRLWTVLWDEFPECQAELRLLRLCGENLPAVLRGDIDPANLLFPDGALSTAEILYQDTPTFRPNNLLVQKAFMEVVRRLPKGKALRILEVGGGTGGTTSFVLPVLPEHCTEYVFTDAASHFTAHAQHKFTQYPFVQCRTLDIERDPIEQGFDAHSFDLIIASGVLHATKDLRKTLAHLKQMLGSGGIVAIGEPTHPWLVTTLILGLQKDWWRFGDDIRRDMPCISQDRWKGLLRETGFGDTACIADCPAADQAQHSLILARGPTLTASPALAPQAAGESKTWLLFVDSGSAGHPSVGAELAAKLQRRGDAVIRVAHGAEFRQGDASSFSVRAGNFEDMRRLLESVGKQVPRLAGIAHVWSLDAPSTEAVTGDALVSSAKLGCITALQLVQALAAIDGFAVDGIWLVTRSTQAIKGRTGTLQVAQAPLWGLGRVAINEYQNLRCRMVDLATGSCDEIDSLAEEMNAAVESEDEIALHGELRYVHRLVPVTQVAAHRTAASSGDEPEPFRIEVPRPGMLDSMCARSVPRTAPQPHEVEIEVAASGLNFMDLMLAMGLLPPEATDAAQNRLGLECSGRIIAVGSDVSRFAVGDEVIAAKLGNLASHVTVDARFVAHKPPHLTFEQGATIPLAFLTAFYSLHTLGQLRQGERVLIHSGTGGVGLAAVQLALKAGAVVFATAGTPEKRALLTALGVPHVMDSRSLAFADEVLKLTDGEGIDIVLNSLSGDAIDKNLSILRPYGRFIEIGKTDIYKNRKIGMRPLRKNLSVFAVDLVDPRPDLARTLLGELQARLEDKTLRPIPHRVFPVARVADAFRDMAQARHIGKQIISIQDRAGLRVEPGEQQSVAIDPNASYLITGGLSGFGLAVAEHLARRGARHLALVGRRGPSASTQAVLESLRQRGVEARVFQADVTDRKQVEEVIAGVRSMGPLRGVMHAAMVLDDAPIERLTEERMWKAMAPKIMGAWNLHSLTADMPLDFFVLFSSIASMIGNAGQANYVAGNTFLEALAHYRKARGLAAVAINWGVVGDVGHVAASPETADRLERLGLKSMPLAELLDALDQIISSDAAQVGVVEVEWKSFLRATGLRRSARYSGLGGESDAEESRLSARSGIHEILEADAASLPALIEAYIRERLARAMGSAPSRIDTQQSLRNLGIDSLIAVEVRNHINSELGVNVPLAKLMQGESINALAAFVAERMQERNGGNGGEAPKGSSSTGAKLDIPLSGADTADLLERIDELTDEEVERHLSLLEPKGNF